MNNQWVKILVFSLLFGIGGFLIGRCCGHGCGNRGGCHKEMACYKDGQCEHGGDCCKEGGKCGKAGCDHAAMMSGCAHGSGGKGGTCCKGEGHHGEDHEARIHTIVHGLKERNFQGDTTIKEEGCIVTIGMHGGKTEVKVEMNDSMKVEEKTVEVHAH